MGDLDHEKKPDAIAAVGEVAFEVLDAQGQGPRENLVERVLRLPLRGSSSMREKARSVNDIVHNDSTYCRGHGSWTWSDLQKWSILYPIPTETRTMSGCAHLNHG